MAKYFMLVNGRREGPFTPEEFVPSGGSASTPVWCDGMPDWQPAREVDELRLLPGGLPPAAPTTAPPRLPVNPAETPDRIPLTVPRPRKGTIPAHILNLICAGIVVLIAAGIDRSGALPWVFLVPAPIFGLIGVAFGRRSVDFWWGYWLGLIGWVVAWRKRVNRNKRVDDEPDVLPRAQV